MNEIASSLPNWQTALKNANLITDLNNSAVDTVSTSLGVYIKKLISIEKNTLVNTDFSSVSFTEANFTDYDSSGVNWITRDIDNTTSITSVTDISSVTNYTETTINARFIKMLSDLDSIMKGINNFINKILFSAQTYVSVAQDVVYTNHPVISKL
ncbi:MAG: hypothetical protein IPM38_13150 [Ignavibacteria bacterium]|nr:hypothetical protein [Ignavibacteria bacterium]